MEDAKWIYDNCIPGTKVEFYSSKTSGPLGKPTAQKITADEEVRNWDPTDPDPNNPWPEYIRNKQEEQNTKPKDEEKNNTTQENNSNNNTSTDANTSTNTNKNENISTSTDANTATNTKNNSNTSQINNEIDNT